jgi:hypothetical protein
MGIKKLLNNDDSAGAFFEAAFEKNPDEDTVAAMKVLKLIDKKITNKRLKSQRVLKNAMKSWPMA